MKKTLLFVIACSCTHTLLHAQCTCSLNISATHKNAVINCTNGSITVSVNGNTCGSIQPVTVTLKDSASGDVINTQYVSGVPDFAPFSNVPAGTYKIVATHPDGCGDSIYHTVPAVPSDPHFNLTSTDITAHACNNGTMGVEITGDYCPSSLIIKAHDTLPPYDSVSFIQTDYCTFCYLAENLHGGLYKVEVYDANDSNHQVKYAPVNEPPCNFYITAEGKPGMRCNLEKIKVHLLGDYCLPNNFAIMVYDSDMVLVDSTNKILNDTTYKFYNISPGQYTVKAIYGGDCSSTTSVTVVKHCPVPEGLKDSTIGTTSERLSWTAYPCANGYQVFYKIKNTQGWQKITVNEQDTDHVDVSGLTTGVTYVWRIRTKCHNNLKSEFSPNKEFTVCQGCRLLGDNNINTFKINPNPGMGLFTVTSFSKSSNLMLAVYNPTGQIIYTKTNCAASELLNLTGYPKGIYLLQLRDSEMILTKRIVLN